MLAAILLVILTAVYRVASALAVHHGSSAWLSNFAPMAAIALCGAVYFPRKFKFALPFAALLLSDLILDAYYHASLFNPIVLSRYLAFGLIGLLGLTLRGKKNLKRLIPASLFASLLFYAVTNAFSWLSDPGYAKNFAGLVQALTVGLPQYGATPTWMFFRNSVLSDLLFTALFVVCMNFSRRQSALLSRAPAPLPN
jgi:hypothetical protein